MNILEQILADKCLEIAARCVETPVAALRDLAAARGPAPDFAAALTAAPIGLIAEVKCKSPSAGPLRVPFDPAAIASSYERGGAQAISVLMDAPYFGGGEEAMRAVRKAVALPLLYKEFVVDPWQVWHAASLGASAVLLIVAALEPETLSSLQAEVRAAGLLPLVEVHDEEDLDLALAAGASCIGINNRNLKTFVTDLDTTYRLAARAPAGCLLVSESGIRSADDVRRLREAGARGILVGEHLLRQPDLEVAVRNLMES